MSQVVKEPIPRGFTRGITFPSAIWDLVDKKRGDVPASKYLLRLVERDLGLKPMIAGSSVGYWENEERK